MSIDYKKLAEPFEPNEIEWRVQQSGKQNDNKTGEVKHWALVLAYVTNRAIQQRLDDVCTPPRWKNSYKQSGVGGLMCGISILDENGWVTKYDGADETNIEAVKGAYSNSMKRAAVMWGIGRYLYDLDTNFVSLTQLKPPVMKGYGVHYDKESKKRLYYKHPELPDFARPSEPIKN